MDLAKALLMAAGNKVSKVFVPNGSFIGTSTSVSTVNARPIIAYGDYYFVGEWVGGTIQVYSIATNSLVKTVEMPAQSSPSMESFMIGKGGSSDYPILFVTQGKSSGGTFTAYDISDPTNPVYKDQIASGFGSNMLWPTMRGTAELFAISATNPWFIRTVFQTNDTFAAATYSEYSIDLTGLAYASNIDRIVGGNVANSFIDSMNLSNPATPTSDDRLSMSPSGYKVMSVRGDIAYIGRTGGLTTIDISSPTNFIQLDDNYTAAANMVEAVSDDVVFGISDTQVKSYNVTNPSNISDISSVNLTENSNGRFSIKDNFMYISRLGKSKVEIQELDGSWV